MKHKGTCKLQTDRLILRAFTENDAEKVYYNWASDDAVTKYLTWPSHQSVEVSREYVGYCVMKYSELSYYQWGIELKDTHGLIGIVSVL